MKKRDFFKPSSRSILRLKQITIFLFLICSTTKIFGQEKIRLTDSIKLKPKYFIDANLHSGIVINNYIYWDSFPSRTPSALLELKFGKQSIGEKEWQQYYGFPQVGFSLIGGYLGNNSELGYTIGIIPNVTLNTLKTDKWSMKWTLGLGFSYFNKPYTKPDNPTNILIGSHFTNMSIAQLSFRRIINDRTDFNFGISAIHASNGHYQLPNVGLNMITAHAGLKHYFTQRPNKFYVDDKYPAKPKDISFGVRFGMGMHEFGNELGPVNGKKYPITDVSVDVRRPAGRLGKAIAGIGYKYYSSFYEKIKEDSTFNSNLKLKSSAITMFLAYEFEMGRMSLLAQGGINVYNPFWKRFTELIDEGWSFLKQLEGIISTRLGLQYYLLDPAKYNKNMYIGMYIKANMGGADFVSLGTGFVF